MHRMTGLIFWSLLLLGQLLAIGLLSWHLLAQINFAYPQGYRLLHLENHIAQFAPQNHYKHEFEYTTPQEHWDLFAEITDAIQHQGKGLANISYTLPNGSTISLMHDAEITHLQDVANLVDKFYIAGIVGAVIWIIFFSIAYYKKINFPRVRNIFGGFIGGIIAITTLVMAIGSTQVFYWFHTKIFPAGHQWFFYYEDSLMTTLMKAPDIFAFIAVLLLSLLITLWGLSTFAMVYLLKINNAKTTHHKKHKHHH